MTTKKDNKAEALSDARKLIDLDVREVSLVDRAAIKREFLVMKRLDDGAVDPAAVTSEVEKTAVPSDDNLAPETKESLTKVMDGLKDAQVPGAEPAILFLSKVLEGKMPGVNVGQAPTDRTAERLLEETTKMDPKTKNDAGQQEGGQTVQASAQAQAPVAKQETTAPAATETPAPAPTAQVEKQKALSTEVAPAVQIMNDGSVIVSGQEVVKGKSFTSTRTSTIKDAALGLANLLKDVDPAALGEVLESFKSELPSNAKVTQQVVPQGTAGGVSMQQGMMKSDAPAAPVTQEVAKADSAPAWAVELQKSVAGLKEQVATIEKARSPSTAATQEGGTDGAKTAEVQKNFWSGILS